MAAPHKIMPPDRICHVIKLLMQDIMMTHPTLRYGQVLISALNHGVDKDTLFYLTNEELIAKLAEYRENLKIAHIPQRERTSMRKRAT
jgi:hypothetical protein